MMEHGDPYGPYMVRGVCAYPSIEGVCGRPEGWKGHRPHYGHTSADRHAYQAGSMLAHSMSSTPSNLWRLHAAVLELLDAMSLAGPGVVEDVDASQMSIDEILEAGGS